jgi:D-sedoheptulose 7-phosphate isomerase
MNSAEHLADLEAALRALRSDLDRLERWGTVIAEAVGRGGRLLAAGNGGSAAHAQHLTAELVGRYLDDRRPLSAIALHADTSALTAIVNDYGAQEAFARSVRAHGRPGDVLVALSTSGRSSNVVAAATTARSLGIRTFALTGPGPNPLALATDDAVCVEGPTPTVQEVHQVAIHLVCAAVDGALASGGDAGDAAVRAASSSPIFTGGASETGVPR